MKRLFIGSTSLLILFIIICVYACNKKPCGDYTCYNKGILLYDTDNCKCICPANTRGENCEVNLIDSIDGDYNTIDTCTMINSISKIIQLDDSTFNLKNLGDFTCSGGDYYIKFVIKNDLINIDSQYVCPTLGTFDGYLFFGSGIIDYETKKIIIDYTVNYYSGGSNQIEKCRVFYEKL
jgi:hypothetical protein